MRRYFMLSVVLLGLVSVEAPRAEAHCQVPCGIYDDQRRFEHLLEDQETIAKAQRSIQELTDSMTNQPDAQTVNQLARWITTKEEHATNSQLIIAQYFMSQRIKPGTDDASTRKYVQQLSSAHEVMLAAMKCKQTADPMSADKLKAAVLDFYRAYEGKEPAFTKEGS